MPRFAYSTINWGTTPDLAAAFAEIHVAGWRALELFLHPLDWMGPVARMERLLADAELSVATSFGAISVPSDERETQTLMRQVEYAAELGASHYGLVGGNRLRQRNPTADEYADLARTCERLAVHGRDLGVDVAYHPHTACTIETGAEIDLLLAQTEVLTLCLDASHIALVDEDPVAQMRRYRDRTSYVHLKDWARGAFTEMGRGTLGIDFPAILADLDAAGFPGWVVVEQSRSDVTPAESARINAEYLRGIGYDPGATGVAR